MSQQPVTDEEDIRVAMLEGGDILVFRAKHARVVHRIPVAVGGTPDGLIEATEATALGVERAVASLRAG